MRILHLSSVRALSAGQRKQLCYEAIAAQELIDAEWHTLAYHTDEPVFPFERRIPMVFRGLFLRNVFAWWVALKLHRDYDYILCRHMPFDPFSLLFSFFIRNRITVHHSKEVQELRLIRPGASGALASLMEALTGAVTVNNTAGLLGVTDDIRDYQVKSRRYRGRSSIYPNGIATKEISLAPDMRRQGQVHAAFICGAFTPWHGLDLLLQSARSDYLKGECNNLKIHLIGRLSLSQAADVASANLLNDIFVIHGTLAVTEYTRILSICDIGIGSLAMFRQGLRQGATLKVRELLAMGIPVISGHYDTVFDSSFPYYKVSEVSVSEIRGFGLGMKGVERSLVRAASSGFIEKRDLMQAVVDWLDD